MAQVKLDMPWLGCEGIGNIPVVIVAAANKTDDAVDEAGSPHAFAWNFVKNSAVVVGMSADGIVGGTYETGRSLLYGDFEGACNNFMDTSLNGAVFVVSVKGTGQIARGAAPAAKVAWRNILKTGDDITGWTFPKPQTLALARPQGFGTSGGALEAGRVATGTGTWGEAQSLFRGTTNLMAASGAGTNKNMRGQRREARRAARRERNAPQVPRKLPSYLNRPPKAAEKIAIIKTRKGPKTYYGKILEEYKGPDGQMMLRVRRLDSKGRYKTSSYYKKDIIDIEEIMPADNNTQI